MNLYKTNRACAVPAPELFFAAGTFLRAKTLFAFQKNSRPLQNEPCLCRPRAALFFVAGAFFTYENALRVSEKQPAITKRIESLYTTKERVLECLCHRFISP